MELKLPLPPNRTYEQVRNHYEVEKAIAERLKSANREERKKIYAVMYDELFAKVPDHPRLMRRENEVDTRRANRTKFALTRTEIDKSTVFGEFAPGDCRFVMEVAPHVKQAIGIDISDQRNPADPVPENFKLIVYDGYNLDEIPDNTLDILFSDQLIEHFHPEDTEYHFQIALRILKPRGKYIFRTPNRLSGPHDISEYFCDTPEGFHLKEWTYTEIRPVLQEAGFGKISARLTFKGRVFRLPYFIFTFMEKLLSVFPRRITKALFNLLPNNISVVAQK